MRSTPAFLQTLFRQKNLNFLLHMDRVLESWTVKFVQTLLDHLRELIYDYDLKVNASNTIIIIFRVQRMCRWRGHGFRVNVSDNEEELNDTYLHGYLFALY